MTSLRLSLVVLLGTMLALGAPTASASSSASRDNRPLVLNVGHRGASGLAPEHTLPAYDLALRLGADYIEQDLQMTSDGVLVVLHDATLDRTARGPAENCTGPVSARTLAEVKTCDVGIWFNEAHPELARSEYAGLRIPTLEEVLRRYGRHANYYIETKGPEGAPGMEEELLRLLGLYGLREPAAERWQVLIQSFSPGSLQKVHALDPALPLIQLYAGLPSTTIASTLPVVETYAVGIGPARQSVDGLLVSAAHSRCLAVHPYTVNEEQEMAALIALGVGGMFTNFPNRLDAVLGLDAWSARRAATTAAGRAAECRGG